LRVFKTKLFARYAKRAGINDKTLWKAVERTECGLIDADLGGNLFKQRISEGSKGYRVLLVYKCKNRTVFLYGFAKNERDNIEDDELESLKELGADWLKANDQTIKNSLEDGRLKEVKNEKKT
jgi:hypothetical protein